LQFAVERLKVSHVMVVGHYGCSGVQAALEGARIGLADNWLRHIQDVRDRHADILEGVDASERANALCELNVIEQVRNVCQSTVLQDAWLRQQEVTVHGWVYGLHDGLLQDLHITADSNSALDAMYTQAVANVSGGQRPR
jgi:carbonic anhydrase